VYHQPGLGGLPLLLRLSEGLGLTRIGRRVCLAVPSTELLPQCAKGSLEAFIANDANLCTSELGGLHGVTHCLERCLGCSNNV